MPVLSALYPIAIVLVLLTLTHKSLGARFPRVYFWTVLLVGIASFATCISSLVAVFGGSIGWLDAALAMLPLQYRRCSATVVFPVCAGVWRSVGDGGCRSIPPIKRHTEFLYAAGLRPSAIVILASSTTAITA